MCLKVRGIWARNVRFLYQAFHRHFPRLVEGVLRFVPFPDQGSKAERRRDSPAQTSPHLWRGFCLQLFCPGVSSAGRMSQEGGQGARGPERGWLLSLDTQRRLASPPHSPPRADKETGERKSRPSPGAHSPTCVAVWTRKPHLSVTVPLGLGALGDPGDTPPHE